MSATLGKLYILSVATIVLSACSGTDTPGPSGGSAGQPQGGRWTGGSGGTASGGTGTQAGTGAGGTYNPGATSGNGGKSPGSGGTGQGTAGTSTGATGGTSTSAGSGGRTNEGGTGGLVSPAGGTGGSAGMPGTAGAFTRPTDPCADRTGYRNLFTEYLQKSQAEVDAKVEAGFKQLFHGGNGQNVYFTTGTDEAYIQDINSNDVRSEGMSYGMTVAVHLDKKEEFDRLWKWSRRVMYQSSGALAGYFAWQATPQGQIIGNSSAPDGEEYFATALIFASQRWGDGTGINNYSAEAKSLLTAMATRGLFNRSNYLVTFGPTGGSASYTDPSYMLPAFYQVWACWDTQNQAFWRSALTASRAFLPKNAHATTGLVSYLANFDGTPRQDGGEGPTFNSDSWRVVGNIMMDHHFYGADPWQTQWAPKYAAFMKTALAMNPVPDKFELDGRVRSSNAMPSKGLVAQNAMLGLGLPAAEGTPFVKELWDMVIPEGQYRYYDGMLYLLAMLHVSGKFKLNY